MTNLKQRTTSGSMGHERAGDLARMKMNSAATIDELREFVGQLKGRNPQEVLGLVAQSGLVKGVLTATCWTLGLIAVFTIGPYFLIAPKEKKTAEKPAPINVPNEAAVDPTKSALDVGSQGGAMTNQEKGVKLMQLDETKEAPADSNPLEKKSELDNLLDVGK
jgi:hypothetical protein